MRVLLFTGKGGVGKTTLAAGTAALAAARGARTLVLSTDAAHSLGDVVGGAPPPGRPAPVADGLWMHQVDVHRRLAQTWRDVQEFLLAVLDVAGVDPLEAEELTVLPGAAEVLALLEVRDAVRSGEWDAVVVDCAPTAETLRLLALPEALRGYLDRLWPMERRVLRAVRPVLARSAVPLPPDHVVAAVDRLHTALGEARGVLTAPDASVRVVLTPESVVVAEARRTLTALSLYGYRVDAVLANRLVPAGGDDPWRIAWARAQAARLDGVAVDVAPLPLLAVPYAPQEPVGPSALRGLAAAVYGDRDPLAVLADPPAFRVDRTEDRYVLVLPLPLVAAGEVAVARRGDDLVIAVGEWRRALALPSALRRCEVVGASVRDEELRVRFTPDPDLWRVPS